MIRTRDTTWSSKLKFLLSRESWKFSLDETTRTKGSQWRESRRTSVLTTWGNKGHCRGTSIGSLTKAKKTYLQVVQNVQLSRWPTRMIRKDEPAIIFTDEDARRLHHPHDNAIVITLGIANYTTGRVLIDSRSSADILYDPAFQIMRINKELLRLVSVPLIGFGGIKVLSLGTISLPVVVGSYPQ